MSRTPPTIVAPLPRDPRVMELAKALNIGRREAFAAAVEAWTWMTMMERDGVVPDAVPDSIDGAVDIPGFGQSMLHAGLVGVVNDGLVLPGELRRQQRDERGGPAAAAGDARGDGRDERRKEQNRAASRKYRRKTRVTGSKAKPSGNNAWRSLGHVAGHEVRVFVGEFGPYAMVVGATINGVQTDKFTTGCKAWNLDTVTLLDALPGLVRKWKDKSRARGLEDAPTLVPSYADFRDDADRLTVLAKLEAAEAAAGTACHADGDDASARHADASAASAGPSADPDADGERKSAADTGLDASAASADRHADAPSSMSYLSKSSSSNEEEDTGDEGRKAAADHERDQGDTAEPKGMAEYDKRQAKRRMMAQRFAEALGKDAETILRLLAVNKPYLRSLLEAAGIDPNTGHPVNAEAPDEPAGARDDIGMTTEASAGDRPAAGSVGARGGEPPEFTVSHEDLRRGLRQQGVPLPTVKTPPAEDDAFVDGVSVGA